MFQTIFFQPLYNGLIFLMDLLPSFDAGVIVILFTVIVKFGLYPLSKKASLAQIEMKEIEPKMVQLRAQYKDNKEELAKKTMELYKENGINPFSGIFVVLIQLPIIFALYFVFLKSGLPELNLDLLYSFVPRPESIDMNFLGIIDITAKSSVLALCAGVSSFFQMRITAPPVLQKKQTDTPSFRDELARNMSLQMRYVFPVVVFFISFTISGVVALYWTTSNLFAIGQELLLRKERQKKSVAVV